METATQKYYMPKKTPVVPEDDGRWRLSIGRYQTEVFSFRCCIWVQGRLGLDFKTDGQWNHQGKIPAKSAKEAFNKLQEFIARHQKEIAKYEQEQNA